MKKYLLVAALALTVPALQPQSASAHAALKAATPAVGGSAKADIKEIKLDFSEKVNPKLSGIVLTGADGKAVTTGAATDAKNGTELVVPLAAPLQPGTYTVSWHAVSDDTHRVTGHYSFKVEK
jgi:methionine-rich copper-binding protein CopC